MTLPPDGQPQPGGEIQWAPPVEGTPPLGGQWEQLGEPTADVPPYAPHAPYGQYGPAAPAAPAAPYPTAAPYPPAAPVAQRGRGRLVAVAAIVVGAVVAGGVATYAAVAEKNHPGGAASPREAIQTIIDDLNKSDLIGVLQDLAPGERAALANPAMDSINELKRLRVFRQSADPSSVAGVQFQASNLQYAADTVTVNDHVQIVQLTGGTVRIGTDLSKVPFTAEFIKAAFPGGVPAGGPGEVNDIAKAVADNGGPLRLAAQQVGGRWYPSIFYTIADNAVHESGLTLSAGDFVPAEGAGSAEDAARGAVTALVRGDLRTAIALTSPEEFAAVHDYGGLIVKKASNDPAPFTIKELQLRSVPISGGARRVTATKVTVVDQKSGREFGVAVDGSCYRLTQFGVSTRMCAQDAISMAASFLSGFGIADNITPEQQAALTHLVAGLTNLGVDATQVGGKWYVNPARSVLDVFTSVLATLQGDDAVQIVRFFSGLGH